MIFPEVYPPKLRDLIDGLRPGDQLPYKRVARAIAGCINEEPQVKAELGLSEEAREEDILDADLRVVAGAFNKCRRPLTGKDILRETWAGKGTVTLARSIFSDLGLSLQ